jgi:hypothetical protein
VQGICILLNQHSSGSTLTFLTSLQSARSYAGLTVSHISNLIDVDSFSDTVCVRNAAVIISCYRPLSVQSTHHLSTKDDTNELNLVIVVDAAYQSLILCYISVPFTADLADPTYLKSENSFRTLKYISLRVTFPFKQNAQISVPDYFCQQRTLLKDKTKSAVNLTSNHLNSLTNPTIRA